MELKLARRPRTGAEGYTIRSTYPHLSKVGGQVGLEIEVEGNKFPQPNWGTEHLIPSEWKYTKDNSLRGKDNAEYIFRKPLDFHEVPKALERLWKMFTEYGSILDDSNRTSVHVHLNVQEFHLNRLCSFVALYTIVEEALTEWCGDHRVGNLFCLRTSDAPYILSKARDFFEKGTPMDFPNGFHYSGMNLAAIQNLGSVEFRALQGERDPRRITKWVAILERLYNLSAEFPDPRDICTSFSGGGAASFFSMIMGNHVDILNDIGWSQASLDDSMLAGVRRAQDLCYCRDWTQYKPVDTTHLPKWKRPSLQGSPQGLNFVAAATWATIAPLPEAEGHTSIPLSSSNTLDEPIYAPIYEDDDEDLYDEDEDEE